MYETLCQMADGMLWAIEKCADVGCDPLPENIAVIAGVYALPYFDGAPVDLDAWNARTHSVRTGRTRKGRTTSIVTKRGSAFVVGSHDIPCTLEMSGRRLRGGWSTLAVSRATDRLFGHALPKLLGTDAQVWPEIIHTDRSDAASGKAGETGDTRITWPTRWSLHRPTPRASDPVAVWADSTIETGTPTRTLDCLAGADDSEHLWHGRRLVARKPPQSARTIVRKRTVGAYRADTLAAVTAALSTLTLDAGQRVTYTAADWNIAVTRGKSGRYSATARHADADAVNVKSARTLTAVAKTLATLTA